jgi:hypothetical protein
MAVLGGKQNNDRRQWKTTADQRLSRERALHMKQKEQSE